MPLNPQDMLEANLENLKKGFPAISKSIGQYLAEGGAYCLEMNGHTSGVVLLVEGDFNEPMKLFWQDEVNDQVKELGMKAKKLQNMVLRPLL